MSVLPGPPSEWFVGIFGEHSNLAMQAFVHAGVAAQERSLDAKAGSRLTSNEAYGSSFWVILPEELAGHLDFLPGREVVRPKGCRYDLLVFEGTLVIPARVGRGSSGPHKIRLGRSEFRSRVFAQVREAAHGALEQQLGLEFEDGVLDSVVMNRSIGSATRVVLAAYEVSAQSGLQHVYVGDATLDTSGNVTWSHLEELQIIRPTGEVPVVADSGGPAIRRFDDAPIPESDLTLLGAYDATEDPDYGPETGTGTEGGADGRP